MTGMRGGGGESKHAELHMYVELEHGARYTLGTHGLQVIFLYLGS